MTPNNPIVSFYSGESPDHRGRFLHEILGWTDEELERVHDYIQWLFPLVERSGFNVNAPVLDERTIQEFHSRSDLQNSLRASFVRMLSFYGLQMAEFPSLNVGLGPSFSERSGNWLTPGNHNHLRITRILKSLRMLGLKPEASAFLECLASIYSEEVTKTFPSITEATFRFWQSASQEEVHH